LIYIKKVLIIDLKKAEIRQYLIDELFLMDEPLEKNQRSKKWGLLLKELVRLNKIQQYIISGNKILFDINDFTYTLDFGSESDIKKLYRKEKINRIISYL
jgi:hypothetical protein